MERADEFTALYNDLESHLRKALRIDRPWDFMNLVNEGVRRGLIHRSLVGEIHDCKSLRNLLVHTPRSPHEALAEPTEWGLARFRDIVEGVVRPQRLIPTFQRDVRVFSPKQPLAEALKFMDTKEYSQIVVKGDAGHALLTVEGIAAWLARTTTNGTVSVGTATVADALACELDGAFTTVSRHTSVNDARLAFERARKRARPRLHAIIITENGEAAEQPLGLVTPWDLVESEEE